MQQAVRGGECYSSAEATLQLNNNVLGCSSALVAGLSLALVFAGFPLALTIAGLSLALSIAGFSGSFWTGGLLVRPTIWTSFRGIYLQFLSILKFQEEKDNKKGGGERRRGQKVQKKEGGDLNTEQISSFIIFFLHPHPPKTNILIFGKYISLLCVNDFVSFIALKENMNKIQSLSVSSDPDPEYLSFKIRTHRTIRE